MYRRYYNEVISYLHNGDCWPGATDFEKTIIQKRASKYKVINGVLYHKGKGRDIEDLRLVATNNADQLNAIRMCHQNNDGIHYGINKTASLLAANYYWRMMYTDVIKFIQRCPICRNNDAEQWNFLHTEEKEKANVWKLVEIELFENFHSTRKNVVHVLRIVDVYSNWTSYVPLTDLSEKSIVKGMMRELSTVGFPLSLRFVSCKSPNSILKILQEELVNFSVVHGRENANEYSVHVSMEENSCARPSTEIFISQYQEVIDKHRASLYIFFGQYRIADDITQDFFFGKLNDFCKEYPYTWTMKLSYLLFSIQNTVPPNMKKSPFSILFGRSGGLFNSELEIEQIVESELLSDSFFTLNKMKRKNVKKPKAKPTKKANCDKSPVVGGVSVASKTSPVRKPKNKKAIFQFNDDLPELNDEENSILEELFPEDERTPKNRRSSVTNKKPNASNKSKKNLELRLPSKNKQSPANKKHVSFSMDKVDSNLILNKWLSPPKNDTLSKDNFSLSPILSPSLTNSDDNSPSNAVKPPEVKVTPGRYSFRQNLKAKGPSSFVHRFIAISTSKRGQSYLECEPPMDISPKRVCKGLTALPKKTGLDSPIQALNTALYGAPPITTVASNLTGLSPPPCSATLLRSALSELASNKSTDKIPGISPLVLLEELDTPAIVPSFEKTIEAPLLSFEASIITSAERLFEADTDILANEVVDEVISSHLDRCESNSKESDSLSLPDGVNHLSKFEEDFIAEALKERNSSLNILPQSVANLFKEQKGEESVLNDLLDVSNTEIVLMEETESSCEATTEDIFNKSGCLAKPIATVKPKFNTPNLEEHISIQNNEFDAKSFDGSIEIPVISAVKLDDNSEIRDAEYTERNNEIPGAKHSETSNEVADTENSETNNKIPNTENSEINNEIPDTENSEINNEISGLENCGSKEFYSHENSLTNIDNKTNIESESPEDRKDELSELERILEVTIVDLEEVKAKNVMNTYSKPIDSIETSVPELIKVKTVDIHSLGHSNNNIPKINLQELSINLERVDENDVSIVMENVLTETIKNCDAFEMDNSLNKSLLIDNGLEQFEIIPPEENTDLKKENEKKLSLFMVNSLNSLISNNQPLLNLSDKSDTLAGSTRTDSEYAKEFDLKTVKVILKTLPIELVRVAIDNSVFIRTIYRGDLKVFYYGNQKLMECDYEPQPTLISAIDLLSQKAKRTSPNKLVKRHVPTEERTFKCPVCPKTFLQNEKMLDLHLKFHCASDVRNLLCPLCQKPGSSWQSLLRHYCTHDEGRDTLQELNVEIPNKSSCTICGKIFASKESVAIHVQKRHPTLPEEGTTYPCELCTEVFSDSKTLKRHKEKHTETLFKCSNCEYRTATHYNYIMHTTLECQNAGKIQIEEKPEPAEVINVDVEVGSIPVEALDQYCCLKCQKTFFGSQLLKEHMRTEHPPNLLAVKPSKFGCDHCPMKFKTVNMLNDHLQARHQDLLLFVCKICEYKCKHKNVMSRHAKKMHPHIHMKQVIQHPKKKWQDVRKQIREAAEEEREKKKKVNEEIAGEVDSATETKDSSLSDEDGDSIPTATMVVHTDENGEIVVCEEDEASDLVLDAEIGIPQTLLLDQNGVTLDSSMTYQLLQSGENLVNSGQGNVLYVSVGGEELEVIDSSEYAETES